MYQVYFFLSLVCLSQAQIPSFGFCPDYLPMAHFDINQFLGKWYEAERYFQFSEVAARCVVTDYAVGPNGKIYVSNEVTNRFTGVKRIIGGNLDLTGKKTEGRLVVKYDTTPISTTTALTILDTDYDTYAVIWSCNGLGPVNAQSAWLMTRERIPDATTLQTAYGVLDKYKISRTFFVKTDQEGCAVAASDLNAALGIASTSTNVEQNAEIDSKKAKESGKVKAQLVPEVLLEIAEKKNSEEENVALRNIAEIPKSAETLTQLPNTETIQSIAGSSIQVKKNSGDESVDENLTVRKLPTVLDSVSDENEGSTSTSRDQTENVSADDPTTPTNVENNDLIEKI